MNHVIILAGGVGSRMKMNIPKQYYEVKGIPIILYSFRKFAANPLIDSIVFVIADEWKSYVEERLIQEEFDLKIVFAKAGKSRQHSVINGLMALKSYAEDGDIVFVHDSVRPLFPQQIVIDGINACKDYDGAIPVISVKDATYQSHDGVSLSTVLPRHELFSGQSPECFVFGKFLMAHSLFTDDQISTIRGCSELAHRAGLSVKLIEGTERNFKITTIEDLQAFSLIIESSGS